MIDFIEQTYVHCRPWFLTPFDVFVEDFVDRQFVFKIISPFPTIFKLKIPIPLFGSFSVNQVWHIKTILKKSFFSDSITFLQNNIFFIYDNLFYQEHDADHIQI